MSRGSVDDGGDFAFDWVFAVRGETLHSGETERSGGEGEGSCLTLGEVEEGGRCGVGCDGDTDRDIDDGGFIMVVVISRGCASCVVICLAEMSM